LLIAIGVFEYRKIATIRFAGRPLRSGCGGGLRRSMNGGAQQQRCEQEPGTGFAAKPHLSIVAAFQHAAVSIQSRSNIAETFAMKESDRRVVLGPQAILTVCATNLPLTSNEMATGKSVIVLRFPGQ